MTEDPRRDLISELRRISGRVEYEDGAAMARFPPDAWPATLDCSGAISWACLRIFGRDTFLDPSAYATPGAFGMWSALPGVDRAALEPGDLAFYDDAAGAWHVMMTTEAGGVIGCCDKARTVQEYLEPAYSERWRLRGFRRLTPSPRED